MLPTALQACLVPFCRARVGSAMAVKSWLGVRLVQPALGLHMPWRDLVPVDALRRELTALQQV